MALDILNSCTGGSAVHNSPVADVSIWEQTIKLDLLGTFLCCRAVVLHMVAQKDEVMVNVMARTPGFEPETYLRHGEGRNSYADALHRRRIYDGGHQGEHHLPRLDQDRTLVPQCEQITRRIAKRQKAGEQYPFSVGTSEDVAAIVLFLASPNPE